jgi:ATP-independent RNA helicase DbpA
MNIEEIITKLGLTLNPMQEATVDAVLHSDKDVVVLSPTGSGKTYAYLLPLAERLDPQSDELQAVVLVPGRELAIQSSQVLKDMGSGLRSMALYGGRPTMDEHRVLRQICPQIVFATPGRLNDHLDKGNISVDSVSWLVIDEFDKMLQMGFQDEMSRIVTRLSSVSRRILLSATDASEIPAYLSDDGHRVQRLNFLDGSEQIPDRIRLMRIVSPDKDKLQTLSLLLRDMGEQSSVVFLNYRESVERTAQFLVDEGFTISMFHGGLDQKQREDAIYKFSNGSSNILVCTDLASRGLDIPDIDNIIHYHIPETEDNYIHRVGRTARWDRQGRVFFILGPQETIPEYVTDDVADYIIPADVTTHKIPVPRMATVYIGKGKKDKISKGDILGFLCKKGGLSSSDIGRIDVKDRYAYAAVTAAKVRSLLKNTLGEKIKGIKTVVEAVR